MAVNIELVADKVFNLLAGKGYEISSLNAEGEKVIDPTEASRFVVNQPNILVRLDQGTETLAMAVREDFDQDDLRSSLKHLSQDYLMKFDYRIFGKTLQPKSETISIAQSSEKQMGDVLEALNDLRKMSGIDIKEYVTSQDQDKVFNYLNDKYGPATGKHKTLRDPNVESSVALDLRRAGLITDLEEAKLLIKHFVSAFGNYESAEPEVEEDFKLSNYGMECPRCGGTKGGETLGGEFDVKPCKCPPDPKPTREGWESVTEGFSSMSGSTKTSYQGLDNVRLIVRHKKEVNEEVRGSRSRNIHSIFIQRGDERFKMAENNLKAARAMARHVKNGGEPFDSVGSAINEMATEQKKLREFVRYVKKSGLVNEENETYVNVAVENINYITSAFTQLAGVKSYANAVESVSDRRNTEILQDDIDLESKFTETHFDEKVNSVVDIIKGAMTRKTQFESVIDTAVSNESFTSLKNLLSEDDGMEFATPHAKLGYQVGQMSSSVTDSSLGNYLSGISKKLYSGTNMSQHEYTTIKSCLLGAHGTSEVPTSVAESVEDQYEQFIEQYDIL